LIDGAKDPFALQKEFAVERRSMRFELRWLIPALLFGCGGREAPLVNSVPLVVPQASSLESFVGKRIQVRGSLLNAGYKGFPHLYESAVKEQEPFFLLSIPESIDWRSRLHRELVVVGIVGELPPFREEQRKPDKIPQGYPQGAIFVRVESMEDAPPK
jgi:hypothetical protein